MPSEQITTCELSVAVLSGAKSQGQRSVELIGRYRGRTSHRCKRSPVSYLNNQSSFFVDTMQRRHTSSEMPIQMRRPRKFGWTMRTQLGLGKDWDIAVVSPHPTRGTILPLLIELGRFVLRARSG